MRKPIQLPEHTMPAKPTFGSQCNHCGLCCSRSLCIVGMALHGNVQAPCPSLIISEGRSRCAVMLAEEKAEHLLAPEMKRFVRDGLKAGQGCTMEDYWLEKYGNPTL